MFVITLGDRIDILKISNLIAKKKKNCCRILQNRVEAGNGGGGGTPNRLFSQRLAGKIQRRESDRMKQKQHCLRNRATQLSKLYYNATCD